MFTWIKTNAMMLMAWTIAALISTLAIMFVMWRGAEDKVDDYRLVVQAQTQVIEAQNHITEYENHIDQLLTRANRRVMESPNAQVLVPPDLADAWIDGINSLRDSGKSPPNRPNADVPRLRGSDAGKGRANNRGADRNLPATGVGVPELQP